MLLTADIPPAAFCRACNCRWTCCCSCRLTASCWWWPRPLTGWRSPLVAYRWWRYARKNHKPRNSRWNKSCGGAKMIPSFLEGSFRKAQFDIFYANEYRVGTWQPAMRGKNGSRCPRSFFLRLHLAVNTFHHEVVPVLRTSSQPPCLSRSFNGGVDHGTAKSQSPRNTSRDLASLITHSASLKSLIMLWKFESHRQSSTVIDCHRFQPPRPGRAATWSPFAQSRSK